MGAHPAVLMVHDGELRELGRMLLCLGVEVHERVGSPAPAERARSWDLVLGTPSRLIELDEGAGRAACRIAALSDDTRTGRAILARSGVQPEPVVVRARVERDEREQGLALAFHDLGAGECSELERTLSLLPMIEMPDSGEEQGGLVVSEILGGGRA